MIERSEVFAGGVIAAANHARGLCKEVYANAGGMMYRKIRYVESSHMHKLFQSYELAMMNNPIPMDLQEWDTVVVCDYGHGMADKAFIEGLDKAKYLAVNVQTNSENYGFNLATKYAKVDYLCVDEPEARLATQNRMGPIETSIMALSRIAPKTCITMGKKGAIGYSQVDGLVHVPAFTDSVVDTMGAGDAFFAVTAVLAREADMRTLLRLGNAAGALKSQVVGHKSSVTKEALIEQLAIHQ
jgi:sugar/nucleoside kinase (ribokinase family)